LRGLCIKTKMGVLSRAFVFGFALLCVATARAGGVSIPHGTLELIAANRALTSGHTVDVGLRFQLETGWHIYWINPGDSGEPLRVEWQLPTGLAAGTILWPTPRRLESSTIVDYGYEGAVLLIVPLRVSTEFAEQQTARIGADVKVLVCSQAMCVPGKAQLSLTLPTETQAPVADARTADLFSAARRSLPRPAPANWKFSVTDAHDSIVLSANVGHRITQAVFFPLVESQIENSAPQKIVPVATGFRLTLRKSDQLMKPIRRIQGVVVLSGEHSQLDQAYAVDVALSKVGGRGSGNRMGCKIILRTDPT
jgi:DsbC/DsbD-like thiol-disulfide interchange protein